MSDKWRRSKAWDDQHLTGPLWPLRILLRAFSSIPLAVFLLTLVAIYGILASVPIGLIVYGLTYIFYAATIILAIAIGAALPAYIVSRLTANVGRAGRFLATFGTFAILTLSVLVGWVYFVWPSLHYDPIAKTGVRFFGSFVDRYSAVTLRRLPFMEMSELEFYSWWPLRVILIAFIVNMITATVRRIEFIFKNIGVLTVHTGIVTIALGSIYYSGLKLEGDMFLRAGAIDPQSGNAAAGPAESVFYDNTTTALYIDQDFRGLEARVLPRGSVPRYNTYGLQLVGSPNPDGSSAPSLKQITRQLQPWNQPSLPLSVPITHSTLNLVDPDIHFRLVGYSPYCEPVEDWIQLEPPTSRVNVDSVGNPLRIVYLFSDLPSDTSDPQGKPGDPTKPAFSFSFIPTSPIDRVKVVPGVLGLEYSRGASQGMPAERWRDLSEKLPDNARAALVVEVPEKNFRQLFPIEQGQTIDIGDTGYRIRVSELAAQPPFPIITKGYQNATSSVAIMTISPPIGQPYERWVYHRFPEISQDLLKELNERGMPKRRDADPAIRVSYIDASMMQVYFDEPDPVGQPGLTRAIVRRPGNGTPAVISSLLPTDRVAFDDKVWLRTGERWDNAEKVERPAPVPSAQQTDRQALGTHERAMLAVEVSTHAPSPNGGTTPTWSRVVWLPFAKYLGLQSDSARKIILPDGRRITLNFARLQHRLPGFEVSLVDFEMIAYDHRGAPRDYQSILRVTHTGEPGVFGTARPFEAFQHITKLNAPLRAPFHWDDDRPQIINTIGRLSSGLSPRQFKFSQAGWDAGGWEESQRLVDQGLAKRPQARYTILGVGNNPGIHIIAAGAILMGLGIPWAFYIKPWLVQREKRKIQKALADGTYIPPKKNPKQQPTVVTSIQPASPQVETTPAPQPSPKSAPSSTA
jgi:hypothetical protein